MWKQQPDKAQIEMSVPCSAFLRSEADFSGLSSRKYQTNLFRVSCCGLWQYTDLICLLDCRYGDDGAATLTVAALWGKKQEVVGEYGYVKR